MRDCTHLVRGCAGCTHLVRDVRDCTHLVRGCAGVARAAAPKNLHDVVLGVRRQVISSGVQADGGASGWEKVEVMAGRCDG